MEKIIMLGTGHGAVIDLYNTCFVIQNDHGNFLVDTGGSIEIVKRLKAKAVDINELKHIFISHSHTDHILGLIWLLKKLTGAIASGKITDKINIYCNDTVYQAITGVAIQTLQEQVVKIIFPILEFHILKNDDTFNINGIDYRFFDINAKGIQQHGFECNLNGKRVMFLGDEPLNERLYPKVVGADYVMHEAFCLDSENNIFHAYEKNHSTVKSTCEVMNKLGVKNLILYHTEDTHVDNKKSLYKEEGKNYFTGNIIIPDDLEEIILN